MKFPTHASLLFYRCSVRKQRLSRIAPGFGPPSQRAPSLHVCVSSSTLPHGRTGRAFPGDSAETVGPSEPSAGSAIVLRFHLSQDCFGRLPNAYLCVSQHQVSQIYTGTPFPSILRSGRGQRRGHYTPRPLLDPARRGEGLAFNLSPQRGREAADGGGDGDALP